MRALACGLLWLCAGCSTYGWTDTTRAADATTGEAPVVVEVVRAPGRSGVDVEAVTRAVIAGLGRAYGGPVRQDVTIAHGARVVCALEQAEALGVGEQLVARVAMRCAVSRGGGEAAPEETVRRALSRQVARGGDGALLADATAEAVTVAAVALGEGMGPELARAVRVVARGQGQQEEKAQVRARRAREVQDVEGP